MNEPMLSEWSDIATPVIGMVHLQPLPASPRYGGDWSRVRDAMLADAEALVDGGVHALLVENFGDAPFHPGRVEATVVSHMTELAARLCRAFPDVVLGINVLRNDGCAALAIAHAVGARFIRVNVLCGARVCDQGVIQGIAHDLLRLRAEVGGRQIRILADVNVKHSASLAPTLIEDEVRDTVERGLADGVIVSGSATGRAGPRSELKAIRCAAGVTPVLVGSGVTAESIGDLARLADGLIIGSAFKRHGVASGPVEPARVRTVMGAWASAPGPPC